MVVLVIGVIVVVVLLSNVTGIDSCGGVGHGVGCGEGCCRVGSSSSRMQLFGFLPLFNEVVLNSGCNCDVGGWWCWC